MLTALIIYRLEDLFSYHSESIINHYTKAMAVNGVICQSVAQNLTVYEQANGDAGTVLRAALRALTDVQCLVLIDHPGRDRAKDLLRDAATMMNMDIMPVEKYCPPFTYTHGHEPNAAAADTHTQEPQDGDLPQRGNQHTAGVGYEQGSLA